MRINLVQLLDILDQQKGTVIVGIVARTAPDMVKKSRADGTPTNERFPSGVNRINQNTFMLGTNYESNVQAQREREGHDDPQGFQAEPLWGGKGHRLGRFLVVHEDKEGQFYFRTRPSANQQGYPTTIREKWLKPAFQNQPEQEITGDELTDLKENFLQKKGPAKKQELEKEIPYRPYKIEGILTITIAGVLYELDHDGEKPQWHVPALQTA